MTDDGSDKQDNGLGDRLDEAIASSGLKQIKVAKLVGVHQSHISRLISKDRLQAGQVLIDRLASALGVNFEWLAVGRGPKVGPKSPVDIFADEFFRRIEFQPTIESFLTSSPRRWPLSVVVAALLTPHERQRDGTPVGGWAKLLDDVQSGRPVKPPAGELRPLPPRPPSGPGAAFPKRAGARKRES